MLPVSLDQPTTSVSPPVAGPGPRGHVICPNCGWRESADAEGCRSCGGALSGSPVQRDSVDVSSSAPRRPVSVPAREARSKLTLPALSNWKFWSLAGLLVLSAYRWIADRPVSYWPGMLVPEAPRQADAGSRPPWQLKDGSRVIPLATYEITARLLHRERYRFDNMSDISPVDFGAGWYGMSDQSVIDSFSFSNSGRYLSFSTPSAELCGLHAGFACNMHMLPANDRIRELLLDLKQGEVFRAKGYLVSVERPGMNPWTSSLSREDSGPGACEIMWVEEFRRVEPPRPTGAVPE